MLAWITVLSEHDRIEKDLAGRAKEALDKAGFAWAGVKFAGRDGALTGQAFDEIQSAGAGEIARGVWGVRSLDNMLGLIEKIDRYMWSASARERRVKLAGYVPNDNLRRDILGIAKATFPGREIDDQMRLARGAPEAGLWLGAVSFGFKQLTGMRRGEVTLESLDLNITGEASDPGSYKSIKTALSSGLPKGLVLKSDTVQPPTVKPFSWSARLVGRQLQLSGHIPSARARTEVLAEIQRVLPTVTLNDRSEIAGGAPEGWPAAAIFAVRQLGRLDEGTAELVDNQLAVTGVAAEEATAVAIRDALQRTLPQGFRAREQITFKSTVRRITPFTTSLAIENQIVTLRGYVPSDQSRAQVISAAQGRFPGRRILDSMEVAAGSEDGWPRCVDAGLGALSRLGNGAFEMKGRSAILSGTATDESALARIRAEVMQNSDRSCEVEVRVAANQATPQVSSVDLERQRAGSEADALRRIEEERQRAEAAAAAARQRAEQERQRTAAVAAEAEARRRAEEERQRAQAADAAARQRAEQERQRTAAASAEADARRRADEERQRALAAAAAETEARRRAEEERQRAQAAVTAEARRKAEDERQKAEAAATAAATARQQAEEARKSAATVLAQGCQERLRSVARDGVILFQRASSDLDRRSTRTLDQIASLARSCPHVMIEVEGHTDSEGIPERNQPLSERRAMAVVDYLKRTGVDAEALTAIGYGDTQPVAPNDTPANMARNRRIDFTVKAR